MKVKILNNLDNAIEIMFIAARTCYSEEGPICMADKVINTLAAEKLVKKVLESGHESIAEHIHITFAIEGISRACSHQLVRHRLCTFSQQSQRYVKINENLEQIKQLYLQTCSQDLSIKQEAMIKATEIVDKYFVRDNDKIGAIKYYFHLMDYLQAINDGCKAEDARMLLPNATKTNIVLTTNLRNLMHMSSLRLCTRAQKEIRLLFISMLTELKQQNRFLSDLIKVQCDKLGYCPEHNCCGRTQTKMEFFN